VAPAAPAAQADAALPAPAAVPAAATLVATVAPTPLPEPTARPTPVPTAPPHALSIAAMRAREYPGSDLVVEQTLPPGVNYTRAIVSYRSEGLKIYALLTVPTGQKPATGWPVVVFNHGYIAPSVYRTTERYIAYTDAFSRNGYIVLKSDYRGHGSSEGTARGGYSSPDYVVDVLNGMASVRRWPDADPNRVGMWGHSMGGYITLRAMVISPDIKAAVIWGGVVGSYPDMLYNWGRPPQSSLGALPPSATPGRPLSWRDQLVLQYGTPEQNPGFWASLSANTYLADLPGPVQLHHGGADHEVPPPMSIALDKEIKAAGGTSELYVYPGDDHDISRNLFTALNRSVAFFDRYVKNS
jgi:dipeptidyl aminopeptidase/acylaminoacyl peptidase